MVFLLSMSMWDSIHGILCLMGKEEKKMKDKRTNKAYNPDKMFDKAITSKWFKRIAKRIKNNLQSPYIIP